jgi:hypothetical protein
MSLALKCKTSKEVLAYLNDGIEKLALETEDLLSKVNLDEDEDTGSSSDTTEDIAKSRLPFKAPKRIKGPMKKRSKDVLEGAKKGKKKGNFTCYVRINSKVSVFSFLVCTQNVQEKMQTMQRRNQYLLHP